MRLRPCLRMETFFCVLVKFPYNCVVFRFSRLAYLDYASLKNLKAALFYENFPARSSVVNDAISLTQFKYYKKEQSKWTKAKTYPKCMIQNR